MEDTILVQDTRVHHLMGPWDIQEALPEVEVRLEDHQAH